eukprot:2758579-Rhodomonas_salina.1
MALAVSGVVDKIVRGQLAENRPLWLVEANSRQQAHREQQSSSRSHGRTLRHYYSLSAPRHCLLRGLEQEQEQEREGLRRGKAVTDSEKE